MSYDPKCFELADYFMGAASDKLKAELAQEIQTGIETWLSVKRREVAEEPSTTSGWQTKVMR